MLKPEQTVFYKMPSSSNSYLQCKVLYVMKDKILLRDLDNGKLINAKPEEIKQRGPR